MEKTFYLAKRHRNLGVACLVFFVLIGVASVYGIWAAALEERRATAIYAAIFVGLCWGFFACLACWLLLAYWREELNVGDRHVAQQRVIGRKEIDLGSLTTVVWSNSPTVGGRIVLRTPSDKMIICLGNFEPLGRLCLIRFFRNELPTAVQENWAMFCYKIALPLRDGDTLAHADPTPDTVTIARRRWDWYFIPVILLSAVFGVITSWKFQQPRLLAAPLAPALLWLVLRAMTPRQGLVTKRITAEPGMMGFLVFEACWLGIALAGFAVFRIWRLPMPLALTPGTIAVVLWFGVLLWRAHQFDRLRRKRDEVNASIATRRWDDGENADVLRCGGT